MTLMTDLRVILVCLLLLLSACSSQIDPKDKSFDKDKAAKTRLSLGLTYLENGNFSQAKFNLDKALEFAPQSAQTHYGMAYYYQTVEEYNSAEQSYQQAMDLAPRDADIANSYGAFLCARGNYTKAKVYFLKAINSDSYISSAETYENLALCSQRHGQLDDAIEYLGSALNHQPGRAKSLFLLADMLLANQQFDAARDTLRRYDKVSEVSAQSLWLASRIEQGAGKEQAAINYANMIVSIYPNHVPAKNYLSAQRNKLKSAPSARKVNKTISELTEQSEPAAADTSEHVPDGLTRYHVVQSKENLYRISLRYNVKMKSLMEWNQIQDPSAIYVGKKLIVVDPKIEE
ncbi:MAG: type IV pilus assembly protein PilF [Paraglaciecola sp.]|jgi:type IV pilus assembly protein PilF